MTVAITSESPESPIQPDVRTLLAAAASGDERAWDKLLDRFGSMIWAIARAHRLCEADAADVTQATWTALLTHLDQLKDALPRVTCLARFPPSRLELRRPLVD